MALNKLAAPLAALALSSASQVGCMDSDNSTNWVRVQQVYMSGSTKACIESPDDTGSKMLKVNGAFITEGDDPLSLIKVTETWPAGDGKVITEQVVFDSDNTWGGTVIDTSGFNSIGRVYAIGNITKVNQKTGEVKETYFDTGVLPGGNIIACEEVSAQECKQECGLECGQACANDCSQECEEICEETTPE